MQNSILATSANIKKANLILSIFILIKYIICLYPYPAGFGYFRDELFQIAMSHHLSFGYASVPPLLSYCLALTRYLFGESLFAIHLFSGTMGAIVLIISRMIIKKLNGGLFALTLSLACITFAPYYLAVNAMSSYDCLSGVFWAMAIYSLTALLTTECKKYWLYFGVAAGLGLMTKFDMFFLGGSIAIALLLTRERKYFLSWQLWASVIIAFLILSPYLIWIAMHNFITIEFFRNYATQTFPATFRQFVFSQIQDMNYIALPVWLAGLYYYFFNSTGKKFRLLGVTYIALIFLGFFMHAKSYVLANFYVALFTGGAVFIEKLFINKKIIVKALLILYIALIFASGTFIIPYVRPILPLTSFPAYNKLIAKLFGMATRTEAWQKEEETMPQIMQDRIGWEEMAAKVSEVYKALPAEKQKRAYVITSNYGEAGAMDFYRGEYAIPPTICGHQQYYLWIPEKIPQNAVFLSIGRSENDLKKNCKNVKPMAKIYTPYAIYYENNIYVYVCEGLKYPVSELKEKIKSMHM